jgi:Fe-S oxidoreductase
MERWLGISAKRPLPEYAAERFDHWFKRRKQLQRKELPSRGRVVLWDDCFVRHHEPQIGQAAVRVLEAAGFEVVLPEGRVCCGRPAFSMGRLDLAARFGRANVAILQNGNEPIVFLEPSCYSMFSEDYRELKVPGAEAVGRRAVLFEQFVEQLLREEPGALRFRPLTGGAAIHAHCHAKALTEVSVMPRLAGRIPDLAVTLLDTGCCGMAGAFGAMAAKYDLSKQVAAGLVGKIEALPPETRVIASGTSCRHQITHLTTARPLHMAELLAEGLEEPSRT